MLVSSIGYFNNEVKSVNTGVENNKKHPIVNEGLKVQNESFESFKNKNLPDFISQIRSLFSRSDNDNKKALNMLA